MSRGPTIREEEIIEAHKLKGEGNKVAQIAELLKRTEPTVRKMLRMQPVKADEQPAS